MDIKWRSPSPTHTPHHHHHHHFSFSLTPHRRPTIPPCGCGGEGDLPDLGDNQGGVPPPPRNAPGTPVCAAMVPGRQTGEEGEGDVGVRGEGGEGGWGRAGEREERGVQRNTKEEQTAIILLDPTRLSYNIYLIETKIQKSERLLPTHPSLQPKLAGRGSDIM